MTLSDSTEFTWDNAHLLKQAGKDCGNENSWVEDMCKTVGNVGRKFSHGNMFEAARRFSETRFSAIEY